MELRRHKRITSGSVSAPVGGERSTTEQSRSAPDGGRYLVLDDLAVDRQERRECVAEVLLVGRIDEQRAPMVHSRLFCGGALLGYY